ncbi:MAG: hypothetical protein ACK4Q5_05960 [Saprospiraceae bacterium]
MTSIPQSSVFEFTATYDAASGRFAATVEALQKFGDDAAVTIDWGDGSQSSGGGDFSHTYASTADFTITIKVGPECDRIILSGGGFKALGGTMPDISTLVLTSNRFTAVPTNLPSSLKTLKMDSNLLTAVVGTSLPAGLEELNLNTNSITTTLPTLPTTLLRLFARGHGTSALPALPAGLVVLDVGANTTVTSYSALTLPATLDTFKANGCTSLTALPSPGANKALKTVDVSSTGVTAANGGKFMCQLAAASIVPDGTLTLALAPTGTNVSETKTALAARGWTITP